MIGEAVYGLTKADAGIRSAQSISFYRTQVNNTTGTVNEQWVNDTGRLLVLKSAVVTARCGAAQTSTARRMSIMPPNPGTESYLSIDFTVTAAAGFASLMWSGEVFVPPAWRLSATDNFSAFANANTFEWAWSGIIIPLGNMLWTYAG